MGNHFTARMGLDSTAAGTVSGAELRRMHDDAHRKSVGVAYLLWFFFGGFGGHRFYAGRIQSAVLQLVAVIVAYSLTELVSEDFSMLGLLTGLWILVDAFLIPGMIRTHNEDLTGPSA